MKDNKVSPETELLYTLFAIAMARQHRIGRRGIIRVWKSVDRMCYEMSTGKRDFLQTKEELERIAKVRCY